MSTLVQIGGTEEYKICEAIKQGRITKPVVCWCIGTCATMFSSEVRGQHSRGVRSAQVTSLHIKSGILKLFPLQVQFGHAGACANQASETAVAKNKALKEAGAFVPKSFDELGEIIKSVKMMRL